MWDVKALHGSRKSGDDVGKSSGGMWCSYLSSIIVIEYVMRRRRDPNVDSKGKSKRLWEMKGLETQGSVVVNDA